MITRVAAAFLLFLAAFIALSNAQAIRSGNQELKLALDAALGEYITSGQYDTDWKKFVTAPPARIQDCTNYPAYPANPVAGGTLATVISRGSLNTGAIASLPLGSSFNNGTDGLMMNFICQKLSTRYGKTITPNYIQTAVSADLLTKLENGELDVVAGGFGKTTAREPLYTFSCPTSVTVSAITRGQKQFNGRFLSPTIADFNQAGVILGVSKGSVGYTLAQNSIQAATLVVFDNFADSFNSTVYGVTHGSIFGYTTSTYTVKNSGLASSLEVGSLNDGIPIALIMRKDSVTPTPSPKASPVPASGAVVSGSLILTSLVASIAALLA